MSWNIYFQAFTVRTWRKRLSNLNTFLTPHIYWGIHITICVNYNQHKEYTLHATLMDKKTGEPLKVADKGVSAELKFTPNSESGTVSINLGEFDATSLDGHTLVVFEELTKQSDIDGKTTDVTVAEHKDINDEGQSVTVTSTPAGSTYGKTGVDMTNIAIAIGILLIAAGCATAYGIKSRKTTKGDADESAEDNTEA